MVDGVLINPLPLPESDRLVSYNFEAPGLGVNVPVIPHSEDMYVFFHERARTVEAFAVFNQDNVNLITEGDPQQIDAMSVTADYFNVIGIQPALGRGFVEGEDRPDAEPVAVLGWASSNNRSAVIATSSDGWSRWTEFNGESWASCPRATR